MHEASGTTGINLRAVMLTALALVATIALVFLGAWLLWRLWGPARAYDAPNAPLDFKVEGPALESAPQAARAAYFAEKEKLLHSWQWIDPQAGVARIPIDEAMRLLAGRSAQQAQAGAQTGGRQDGQRRAQEGQR